MGVCSTSIFQNAKSITTTNGLCLAGEFVGLDLVNADAQASDGHPGIVWWGAVDGADSDVGWKVDY